MTGAAILHSGIALTVSGVSRCVSVEAYTAVALVPAVSGVGIVVALDLPLVAEACGVANLAVLEDVDVKVVGRGLGFAPRLLGELLADLVEAAYASGEMEEALERLRGRLGYELLAASLSGSSLLVGPERFPLPDVQGTWAVVARTGLPTGRLLAEASELDPARVVEHVEQGIDGIAELGHVLAARAGRRYEKLVRRALRAGAEAAFIDAYTGNLVAITLDDVDAGIVASRLQRLAPVAEAPVVP